MNTVLKAHFHNALDFFTLLGRAAWGPERPAPTNLDGLADLLRESSVSSVHIHGIWDLDVSTTATIKRVFADCEATLTLPT